MKDVTPELREELFNEFGKLVGSNFSIKTFLKKLEKGSATQSDCSLYSRHLGECAAEAIRRVLAEDKMPDGRLYWNIAQGTVKPLMEDVYNRVMKAAVIIQEREDKETGVGIKPYVPPFPAERLDKIISTVCNQMEALENEL